MIKLDINYDPELPPFMQGPPEIPPPKPRFPYNWRTDSVDALGLRFVRKRVANAGPRHDPYAGEVWTCKRRWFKFYYSNVICCVVEVEFLWYTFESRAAFFKGLRWWARKAADFLERRYEWHMNYEHVEDPYGSLEYYE